MIFTAEDAEDAEILPALSARGERGETKSLYWNTDKKVCVEILMVHLCPIFSFRQHPLL